MSNHIQQTQPTSLGTAENFSKERESAKKNFNKIEKFNDDVQIALMVAQEQGDGLPLVETSRDVIEHFNRQNLKGFDATGYFMHKGVVVCESGQAQKIKDAMAVSQSVEPMELAALLREQKKAAQ